MDCAQRTSLQDAPAPSRQFQLMADIVRHLLVRKPFIIIMYGDPLAQCLMYLLVQDVVQLWLPHQHQAETVQGVIAVV